MEELNVPRIFFTLRKGVVTLFFISFISFGIS